MAIEAGDAIVKIGADRGNLDSEMSAANASVAAACTGIVNSFTMAGAAATAFGLAVMSALGTAVKAAADFEKAMREVNTMMDLSESQFAAFSDEIRQLSVEMGVNAVEAAEALYQAISAGVPKENAVDFLRIATQAAIGGVTDTETAVDGLTTVLNAFKMPVSEAEHVADVMFTTVRRGKTTFEELAQSIYNVAPIAAASGVSFEEVAAALASITKQGVPTAVATTQLRAAIQAVTAPTIRQKKWIEEYGVSVGVAAVESKGLVGVFEELITATHGDMEAMRRLIGSVEGVQAVLALTGQNAQVFAEDMAAVDAAVGASAGAFEEMELSLSRHIDRLKAGFGGLAIEAGEVLAPAVGWVVDRVIDLIEVFDKLPEPLKTMIVVGAALGGTLAMLAGGLLLMAGMAPLVSKALIALSTTSIPQLISSVAAVIKALWAWVAAQLAVLAAQPWMWAALAAGIAMITAGVILVSKHSSQATKDIDSTGQAAVGLSSDLGTATQALSEYKDEVAAATAGITSLGDSTVAAAAGQVELAAATKVATEAIAEEVSAAQELIGWLNQIFQAQYPGGMTMEELGKWTKQETHVIPWEDWYSYWYGEGEKPPYEDWVKQFPGMGEEHQHGAWLTEPTMLWGLRSGKLLGTAAESGIERLGPAQGGGVAIQNDFHIAQLVVREEADVPKIARELLNMQNQNLRSRGMS